MLSVWFVFPAIAALFVCPIAILVCVLRSSSDTASRFTVIALESMIVFAHLFAMLPMVQ